MIPTRLPASRWPATPRMSAWPKPTVATEKRDAAYAVANEKCGSLADDAKATCIKEAKVRHGQS